MTRRATHQSVPVTYGAVGASNDPNVVKYPPEGFNGHFEEVLLGRGTAEFQRAVTTLMTWGAQRGVGIEVTDVQQDVSSTYHGVRFDDKGQPVEQLTDDEASYSETGEAFLTAGLSATLVWPNRVYVGLHRRPSRRIRVMYTLDEDRRVGFAMGTLDENGVIGEELFMVEQRDDGTVWGVVRGFLAAPDAGWLSIKGIALVRLAVLSSRAQIQALAIHAQAIDDTEEQ